MRRVAVVTGTRSEYGLLRGFMKELAKSKSLQLEIIATGMHLMPEYEQTLKEIEADFPKACIRTVEMNLENDSRAAMARYLASGIQNFTNQFQRHKPDIVFVLGDRSEPLAAAISAAYLGIPVAHAQGGDVTGSMIDESIRHSITKFAHIHFPATEKSAERLKKLGEDPKNIRVVGTMGLEEIKKSGFPDKQSLFKKYGLDIKKKVLLVLQHPVSVEAEKAGKQLEETLEAVREASAEACFQSLVIYPNCDSGSREEIRLIEKARKQEFVKAVPSVPRSDFVGFLHCADLIVGNSSSAFLEAPTLGLQAVNIGNRQDGRERSQNVIGTRQSKQEIKKAILKALANPSLKEKAKKCVNPYYAKDTNKRVISVLESVKLGKLLLEKKFCD